MADNTGNSNTGIVAVLVVFVVVMVLAVGLFAYRGQIFGGGADETKKVEINLTTPSE